MTLMFLSCSTKEDKTVDVARTNNLRLCDRLSALDKKLDAPKPGEWLYQHTEKGQDFETYKKSNPVSPAPGHATIYIQPIGEFSGMENYIVDSTVDYLHIFFNLEVKKLLTLPESVIPVTSRRRHPEGHEQFLTTFILDYLKTRMPDDATVLMAITTKDLYPKESWNFVFGQARLKERVGVSSMYRFGLEDLDSASYPVVLDRMIKTSSHETGHMFTCQHCINAYCVMNGSNGVFETDFRPTRLCSECMKKLTWNLNWDVMDRAKKLKTFFYKHHLYYPFKDAGLDLKLLRGEASKQTE